MNLRTNNRRAPADPFSGLVNPTASVQAHVRLESEFVQRSQVYRPLDKPRPMREGQEDVAAFDEAIEAGDSGRRMGA